VERPQGNRELEATRLIVRLTGRWGFYAAFATSREYTLIRTLMVLTDTYLAAPFTQPEWAEAFRRDPTGQRTLLIPVRAETCHVRGMFDQIVYVDLVGLTEDQASRKLREEIDNIGERTKP